MRTKKLKSGSSSHFRTDYVSFEKLIILNCARVISPWSLQAFAMTSFALKKIIICKCIFCYNIFKKTINPKVDMQQEY